MWRTGLNLLQRLKKRTKDAATAGIEKKYSATLPDGFGARGITLRLCTPPLPERPLLSFSEHVMDAS